MRHLFRHTLLPFAALAASVCACDGPNATSSTATGSAAAPATSALAPRDKDVVATVNGVAIREADMRLALSKSSHGAEAGSDPDRAKTALETIIRNELIRQAAVAAKLEGNPKYLQKLRAMEAQLNEFRRDALSDVYFRHQIAGKSRVTEAEARKYFDANTSRIKTEIHVLQILVKDKAKITAMKKEIDGGAAFEEVAAKQFPTTLSKQKQPPWDLGFLKWSQVPKSWRPQIDQLKDGEISDVIPGPKKRFWLVKLVKRQVNNDITFAQVKPALMELIKGTKTDELREQTNKQLRSKAAIKYLRDPATVKLTAPPSSEK